MKVKHIRKVETTHTTQLKNKNLEHLKKAGVFFAPLGTSKKSAKAGL